MKWIRAGLSVFIAYHFVCVLLAPISDSYVGMKFASVVRPYVYFFEMTNAWNFFAPNPAPPIYVEYEVDDGAGEVLSKAMWPALKSPYFFRERQNRRISSTDFMMSSESMVEKIMVPFLCHADPRAISVRLWRVVYTFPSAAEIESGKRQIGDDVGKERRFVSHSFCERPVK